MDLTKQELQGLQFTAPPCTTIYTIDFTRGGDTTWWADFEISTYISPERLAKYIKDGVYVLYYKIYELW